MTKLNWISSGDLPLQAPRADVPLQVKARGAELYRDPLLNKGSGFSPQERVLLGLDGLLPSRVNTMAQQARRVHMTLDRLRDPFDKYLELSALQDRNEQLFYRVLCDQLKQLMPVIYTPTVGKATREFSHVFRRARGVWITPDHRGRVAEVLRNATQGRPVKLIVATDNESILGIGDQGAGGMAIAIGKLALYCAAAAIHPVYTLPVSLDVGTDSASLLEDEIYLGWPARRLRGDAYDALVEEFVEAVCEVFPGALLQWEDFRKDNASRLLDRYRDRLPSFNDDIQGTGAVCLAGVLTGLMGGGEDVAAQRAVVLGAGAAGLGITRQLAGAIRAAGGDEYPVAVLDSRGLLVGDTFRDEYKVELAWPAEVAAARGFGEQSGASLLEVVEKFKPSILVGVAGQPGAFTEPVVRAMAQNAARPIIMPLSNPTDYAEARPEEVLRWTDGRALVATGSPFADVVLDGRRHAIGQGNNVFIFPGLGLGALLSEARAVSEGMIAAAARTLAEVVRQESLGESRLYPRIARLRDTTRQVAAAVMRAAVEEGLSRGQSPGQSPLDEAAIQARLDAARWEPEYPPYEAG
ncbi:NAD-dependent malic enzyme [Thioalkalivibrio sp. XN8]|uniref:NAD-dependent malic enzyme n=1 Tax=Thioalkalivibrio sp. XN8 TaxID=2712863 RepID=UPI0013ED5603|nr:NAD-dependent malic enzyme [Thioalkalivibrio sp. XN8]NGP53550.1 NAD-dependent malic enzyme [Thioalkalivibrio sp. XN8]